jgi:hypothetical protein
VPAQRLAAALQPAAQQRQPPAEPAGGLGLAEPFQVAEDERVAELGRQPGQLGVEQPAQVAPGEVVGGGGLRGGVTLFAPAAAGVAAAGLAGDAQGGAVQPPGQCVG